MLQELRLSGNRLTGCVPIVLLSGSGTDMLALAAAPGGQTALIVGESKIAWIGFGWDA